MYKYTPPEIDTSSCRNRLSSCRNCRHQVHKKTHHPRGMDRHSPNGPPSESLEGCVPSGPSSICACSRAARNPANIPVYIKMMYIIAHSIP